MSNALTLSDLEQSPISPKAFDILVTSESHVLARTSHWEKSGRLKRPIHLKNERLKK